MIARSPQAIILQFIGALNNGCFDDACALVGKDAIFVDAKGVEIRGRTGCRIFVKRLCDFAEHYHLDVQSVAFERDEFLIDGELSGTFEEFSGRVFSRAKIDGGKLVRLQTFKGGNVPSLAKILAPDRVAS